VDDEVGPRDLTNDYARAEVAGRLALMGWIRHKAVRANVVVAREKAERAVEPLARYLIDQFMVSVFVAGVLDVTGRNPHGEEFPNPFGELWELTDAERFASRGVAAAFLDVLEKLASTLADVGVPLDPQADGNLFILGQLLLLDVNFALPAAQLVDCLNSLPVVGFTRNGRDLITSDHASNEDVRGVERIRRAYRDSIGGPYIRPPYAGGGQRNSPRRTAVRREGIREVRRVFPACTVGDILTSWNGDSQATAGGILRTMMGMLLGSRCPSRRALKNDFDLLDADSQL